MKRSSFDLQQARWVIPVLIAVLFVLVERQRVSTQIVARYPDFFAFAERAALFDPANLRAFDWAYGLYPLGYPLLLWAGVKLGLDVLTTAFVLSILGGALGLLGAFALAWLLSGSYGVAVLTEAFVGCIGQYLYHGSLESTDMLAAGMQIAALALLVYADRRWRWAGAAGLLLGASYLIRYTASLTIMLCAIYLLTLAVVRRERAWAAAGAAFLIGAVVGGSPQLIASAIVKGNPFYSTQGHNLWFTLTGSIDYLGDWNARPMEMSMLDVFRQYPREVVSHWWLEFSNFWITPNANFIGRPLYGLFQAGLLFVMLWRNGLKGQARFFVALIVMGNLVLLSLMRLDKRFLLLLMPLVVFGAVYFLWQLVPAGIPLKRWTLPVRWPVLIVLALWAAAGPWGFRSSNLRDTETIQVSNLLHAAGMKSYRQVFSSHQLLQDVADPWKRRFGSVALVTRGIESDEQLLKLLDERGYRFFIYDQDTGKQLYPKLAALQFIDNHLPGLAPLYAPEKGEFAVYRMVQAGQSEVRPLDVSFGNDMRLTGYESHLSQAQPSGNGDQLGTFLYWTSSRPIADQLKVFVHVVNEKGELMGQHDSEPQVGGYPTNEWKANETVCDFHLVSLGRLPPGAYTIRVGLYQESTGQRVGVMAAKGQTVVDNAVVIETLMIQ